jgi:hypothetical protein
MYGITTAAAALEYLEEFKAKTVAPADSYDFGLSLARWEGYAHVLTRVEAIEIGAKNAGADDARIAFIAMREIAGILANGADDTWSGRGNERRRSYFDGMTEGARAIMGRLDQNFADATQ